MPRLKERKKFLHEPSTHEIFLCLAEMPFYSKILFDHSEGSRFHHFLRHLIDKNFYNDRTQKISVKQMAKDAGTDATRATKWLREIYEGIFNLNDEQPLLFQNKAIAVRLLCSNGDNYCSFDTSFAVLPCEFETFSFYFVKAKVGADRFWVKKVEHEITDMDNRIMIWLEGSILNKYREYALDKALFLEWIHFMDVHDQSSCELDERLKKLSRN